MVIESLESHQVRQTKDYWFHLKLRFSSLDLNEKRLPLTTDKNTLEHIVI